MKQIQCLIKKSYSRKLLVASVAAFYTFLAATSVARASDIDIYQEAKSGQITLMFMIDISGSMTNEHSTTSTARAACELTTTMTAKSAMQTPITGGPTYRRQWCEQNNQWVADDRITRVKDGMMDLLYGNPNKNITRISDDKVIGLSTLGANDGRRITVDQNSGYDTGAVLVPARRLDAEVLVGSVKKSQRQVLIDAVLALEPKGATPTARSYAETIAYMMGTSTQSRSNDNKVYYFEYTSGTQTYYRECSSWSDNNCSKFVGETATNPIASPDDYNTSTCTYYIKSDNTARTTYANGYTQYSGKCYTGWATTNIAGSGWGYSKDETKNLISKRYNPPASLAQADGIKKCSGQGIYILTDGAASNDGSPRALMRNALDNSSFNCSTTSADSTYACVQAMAITLLNASYTPMKVKVKTAVVGFGGDFNKLATYDRTKSQLENLTPFLEKNADNTLKKDINGNVIKRTNLTAVEESAYWGIIGEGGWYSGSSSQDIVNSVNSFLGDLKTDIPSVTTGSPTIPKDMLNPAVLQDDAYYQQFQPAPDKGYQLWVGNMKKYLVATSGQLQGRNGASVTDSKGQIIKPTYDATGKLTTATYDFWSTAIDSSTTIADADENTFGSKKFAAKGGVWSELKLGTGTDGKAQRKLFTNRIASGTGTSATFSSGQSLRKVDLSYLTDSTYQNDPYRGYLISLLGFTVDAGNPSTITTNSLSSAVELRQVGSVMHSLPVLVTNKGKVAYNTSTKKIESTGREDYVLFGTTQGLLQVVDAKTGAEKFAFVPNEMVDNQKEAFLNYTSTSGGMSNLFYGVDGPWSLYSEYVVDGTGNLTVGSGKGTEQKGKQLAFGGLRMGGRSYYSLNLQDIDNPVLNFYINPTGTCSNSNPLGCMGQSWSKPSLGHVNWGGTRKLVMFVGGGYDTGYESDTYDQSNKKGAGVYMFSAEGSDAGKLLWWASANASSSTNTTLPIGKNNSDLKYSVVSEIRTVDRNGDDLIDHLYFGDLGGQLFRIDLDNNASDLTKFAKAPVRLLNLHESNGASPRFYDMPSFSIYNNNGDTFAAISVGSGNRSKPLANYTTGTANTNFDAIYNIYDKDVASKSLYTTGSTLTHDVTRATLGKLTEDNRYSTKALAAPLGSTDGWYYEFDNCVKGIDGKKTGCDVYKLQSEKVFGTPLAMNYRLYVSTFDSSKPGLSGDCGAGVKGESLLSTFCLPYGQCDSTNAGSRGTPIGVGIHNVTVGNCTGTDCGTDDTQNNGGSGGSQNGGNIIASASNYCASTGGRMAITVIGGVGKGEATKMCLIPQRWYERNSLIK